MAETTDRPTVKFRKPKPIRIPGKHKGNIPAAAIRAAVKKVVAARHKREAEEEAAAAAAAASGTPLD